ncbi:MAG: 16S rRNA (cytidine(1402)-2'-O)-methyltransferase [Gaiellales bacterium]
MPLAVCATPIGNLDDVTQRVLDELERADVVACEDTRRTRTLIASRGIQARLLSLHEHNEAQRVPELLERLSSGERVALVSDAGMPAVSDPGRRLIDAALDAGVEVTVLPGPSAVTAAAAASGLAGGGFVFCGFLPRTAAQIAALLDRVDISGLPVVAFESPRRLPGTLRTLADRDPARRAAVCRELTKLHEQIARGTVGELAEAFSEPPRGEVTLVLEARADAAQTEVDEAALAELGEAVGVRRAAELASRLTGVPRNQLYRRLTER